VDDDGVPVETFAPPGEVIFELTEGNFDSAISSPVPTMVEAYIQGQQQSQELSDKLHKIVSGFDGAIRLARLNIQQEQSIAEELKITHIPTILGIIDGKMFYNRIVGLPTDVSLKNFVNALFAYSYRKELEHILGEAEAQLEQNNVEGAAKLFNKVLTDKKFTFAQAFGLAGLAQCALKEGNLDVSQHLVKTIQSSHEDSLNIPKIKQVISQIELQCMEGSNVDVEGLLAKITENPKDLQSLYDLGVHYQRLGRYEDAMNQMFKIIKVDKEWNDQASKHNLLKIFDSLGSEHELTLKGRRRLNNMWFV